jgi:hypothetical protein
VQSETKPAYREANLVSDSMISAIGSAAMRSSVSEAASSEPTAAPIRTAAYRPAQRRGIRRPNRIRPRSFERSPVLYAAGRNTVRNTVSATAKKPPVVRWEVEPPSRPQYRMYVPVVLTDGNPDGGESVSATPAVIEVAFDPNMPPQP